MARVTVIDDSSDFLDLMSDILTDLGHEMTGLAAVRSSIHEVADTRPELLVIDLLLEQPAQEVSGWELTLLARSHRYLVGVPIILCTAAVWEIERRATDLAEIAGVHVMTKPFGLDEMTTLIGELLASPVPMSRRRSAPRRASQG